MTWRMVACLILVINMSGRCAASRIDWCTVNSGGGTSASASHTVIGTIGQPVVGMAAACPPSSQLHYIGFWYGTPGSVTSISALRGLSDGAYVYIPGLYATTLSPSDFDDRIYIEQGNRASGIQFYHGSGPIPSVTEGNIVGVIGTLGTENGERRLVGSAVFPTPSAIVLRPLGMQGKSVGGTDAPGQAGVSDGGTNNVGLLVRVFGQVVGLRVEDGKTFLLVNDGSCPAGDELRVDTSKLDTIPESGWATITGISSVELLPSGLKPIVRPRRASDLMVLH